MPIDADYILSLGSGPSRFTVEDLFRKLSYGELSNHSVSVDATGAIKKDKQNQIIHFANEGLLKLHSRFALIRSDKILTMTGAEMVEPLGADVIQVLSILTAWGESLTFYTRPSPTVPYVFNRELRIPKYPSNSELQVEFQHSHPVLLPIKQDSDLTQEITLMGELHEALTAWIAHKVYGNMLSPEGQAASIGYKNRYESVIVEAQNAGVLPDEMHPQNKFEQRGWV